jgi:hypothetical protein
MYDRVRRAMHSFSSLAHAAGHVPRGAVVTSIFKLPTAEMLNKIIDRMRAALGIPVHQAQCSAPAEPRPRFIHFVMPLETCINNPSGAFMAALREAKGRQGGRAGRHLRQGDSCPARRFCRDDRQPARQAPAVGAQAGAAGAAAADAPPSTASAPLGAVGAPRAAMCVDAPGAAGAAAAVDPPGAASAPLGAPRAAVGVDALGALGAQAGAAGCGRAAGRRERAAGRLGRAARRHGRSRLEL